MTQQYQPQGRGVSQSRSVGTSQQGISQGQSGQQFQPAHFDEALKSESRAALEDLSWLRKQTKWAAQQAHVKLQGTGIETTLEAISEIAELNEELILGNSKFVPYYADTFRQVASDAIQELQQFKQEQFIEAVVTDLTRAVHSIEELLAATGGPTQQGGSQTSQGMQSQQSQIPQQGQRVGTQGQSPMQGQGMGTQSQSQMSPQTQSQPFQRSQY